jgi:hypothetical protein
MQPFVGRDVAIYCPATQADWDTFVASLNGPPNATGYTPVVGGNETYISYGVCTPLQKRLSRAPTTLAELERPFFVLTHESEHVKGIRDEGQADCAAISDVPQTAKAFGIRDPRKLRLIVAWSKSYHARKPPPYNAPCA